MPPHLLPVLRTGLERAFGVAHAPIVNGLQLSKIADQNYRDVPKGVLVGINGSFAETPPLRLLQAEVHACGKRGR